MGVCEDGGEVYLIEMYDKWEYERVDVWVIKKMIGDLGV